MLRDNTQVCYAAATARRKTQQLPGQLSIRGAHLTLKLAHYRLKTLSLTALGFHCRHYHGWRMKELRINLATFIYKQELSHDYCTRQAAVPHWLA